MCYFIKLKYMKGKQTIVLVKSTALKRLVTLREDGL